MDESSVTPATGPGAGLWVILGAAVIVALGGLMYVLLRDAGTDRGAVPTDPLLAEGYEVYRSRCASCHGERGKGDGPVAAGLAGPPPGDLTDAEWKHGDRPEDVLAVVLEGVPNTGMPGWRGLLGESQVRGASAYVYHLAGRPVPEALRVASP